MRRMFLIALLAVGVVVAAASCSRKANQNAESTKLAANDQPTPNDESPCLAPDVWFNDNKTPAVPADFKVAENKECEFYKFAWQSFLWLTQSEDGGNASPRFLDFKTPNDLFRTANDAPHQLVAAPRAKDDKKTLSLAVRTMHIDKNGKGHVSASGFAQAGSQGVVVDRNNRAIYYGIHLNDRFVEFINKDLKLTNPGQIKDVPLTTEFPQGCLELKSSWRVLTEEEKKPENLAKLKEKFFIIDAQVPTLFKDPNDELIKADPAKPRPETVALVGLHVVGTIVDHPEFIWASFEHIENSPTPKVPNLPADQPVDDAKDYTFYRKGTKLKDCNLNAVDSTTLKLTDVDKQTLEPVVDAIRLFNSADDGVGEDKDVGSLNVSVQSKLKGNLAIWKNYKLIGAVWLDKPADAFKENKKFTKDNDKEMAGETRLSNSTMETFTQGVNARVNCFRCHNTQAESANGKDLPGLRIKVSHVIRNAFIGPSN